MIPEISTEQATGKDWDVALVGSSFASMFYLLGLPASLSVLIIESGPVLSHREILADNTDTSVDVAQKNRSGREKTWVKNSVFGGDSNCWWGQTPRFHPDDFETKSRFGIAEDWPIRYDDLEPFYSDAEKVMQISGGGDEHILRRTEPYPFPPHALSRSDAFLQEKDRVILEEDEPVIEWQGHSDYAYAGLAHAKDNLQSVFPVEVEALRTLWKPSSEAHIQGTTRMGGTNDDSVINHMLQTHEVPNVPCLGAGAFPACSPANPTLTLSALSLRAARLGT